MIRTGGLLCVFGLCASLALADGKYTIGMAKTKAPEQLQPPIQKLLSDHSIKLQDDKGEVVAEVWLSKEIPAKATPEQVKNGLTYREVEEGTLFGAIRFDRLMTDYRKQKIMPGVYTLRLGYQPMDGDHMGTSPHSEFFLLVPAALDAMPAAPEAKELRELSAKAVKTSHPGILMLFPNIKPENAPQLVSKENNHWVLNYKATISVGGTKTTLGVGLTLVGHSTLE